MGRLLLRRDAGFNQRLPRLPVSRLPARAIKELAKDQKLEALRHDENPRGVPAGANGLAMPNASVTKHLTNEKERYQEAAKTLATLLHGQTIFIDSVKLVGAGNAVNAKALGYIYGLADCALRLAKLDVGSEHAAGLLAFLISEFDEANVARLYEYVRSPSDRVKLMEGVMRGRNDYDAWDKSHGMMIALRWDECFS